MDPVFIGLSARERRWSIETAGPGLGLCQDFKSYRDRNKEKITDPLCH